MIDERSVASWIESYVREWRRPGTAGLSSLFAPSATYRGTPFGQTHRGMEEIAELWERERSGPDESFTLDYEVVAVTDPRAVARLEVTYDPPDGQRYRDIWLLEFAADGRCESFEEWPYWPDGSTGSSAT